MDCATLSLFQAHCARSASQLCDTGEVAHVPSCHQTTEFRNQTLPLITNKLFVPNVRVEKHRNVSPHMLPASHTFGLRKFYATNKNKTNHFNWKICTKTVSTIKSNWYQSKIVVARCECVFGVCSDVTAAVHTMRSRVLWHFGSANSGSPDDAASRYKRT